MQGAPKIVKIKNRIFEIFYYKINSTVLFYLYNIRNMPKKVISCGISIASLNARKKSNERKARKASKADNAVIENKLYNEKQKTHVKNKAYTLKDPDDAFNDLVDAWEASKNSKHI